jgi:DNA-binding NtrC family response regulator
MHNRQARVLIVENSRQTLARALQSALIRHEVQVARGAFDALNRIDCEGSPYEVVFCDLSDRACNDLAAPELWASLSLRRATVARRMVFLASGRLSSKASAFLDRIPDPCVALPIDAEAIDALVNRRATRHRLVREPAESAQSIVSVRAGGSAADS